MRKSMQDAETAGDRLECARRNRPHDHCCGQGAVHARDRNAGGIAAVEADIHQRQRQNVEPEPSQRGAQLFHLAIGPVRKDQYRICHVCVSVSW